MKKTWIKIYEICPECDGTGWTKYELPGYEGSALPDCTCDDGKVGEFVEIDNLIKRIEYLETKCKVLESSNNDVRCDLIK